MTENRDDPHNTTDRGEIELISLEASVMEENNRLALENRALLASRGIHALNLLSSPGSGKTTLLVETLKAFKENLCCAVIEGDQQTKHDAEMIAETGTQVVQINTGQSCHLDAVQVARALEKLPLDGVRILFIENVGNLICPAGFDLGESEKVAIMSVTEGEEKPLKYPLAFHLASTLVITKTDLLPLLRFDLERCRNNALQVNPDLGIIETSAYTKGGIEEWISYLRARVATDA
jgi:hydrogenase nickel incorporation protein HypB